MTARSFSVATQGHKYPQRELAVTNAGDTRTVILALLPHLIVKRPRALEALKALNYAHDMKVLYGNKYRTHLAKLALVEGSN